MNEQGNKFICLVEHNKDAFLALPPPPNSYKLPSAQGTDEPPVSDIRHQLERLWDKESGNSTENTISTQHPENPGKISATENSRNQAKCSACGSSRLRKNGKRGNAQKYICKDCGKNFSRGA